MAIVGSGTALASIEAERVNFTTSRSIVYGGVTLANATGGLHVQWDAGEKVTLRASHVSVEIEWERGESLTTPDGSKYRLAQDEGRDVHNFTDVDVTLEPWKRDGQALVVPTGSQARVEGRGTGESRASALHEARLAAAGYSDSGAGAGGEVRPGFRYDTPTPLVAHETLDRASARGDFTLFVNNVTLSANPDDRPAWSNWSGLRVDRTGPGVDGYELRVAVLEVTSGSLEGEVEDGVTVLGRSVTTTWEGSLETRGAEGWIDLSDGSQRLQDDRLKLAGTGTISTRTLEPRSGEDRPVALDATVGGSLEVLSAGNGELRTPASPSDTGGTSAGAVWLGLLGSVAAALAAAVVPGAKPGLLRGLPEPLRRRLYDRWRRRADRRADRGEFDAAARLYHRAARLFPDKPAPRFHRALALLDAGEYGASIEAVETARARLGEVAPPDLLEVKVAAARRLGDDQRALEGLIQLARRSPGMARGLIEDLSLGDLADDPRLRDVLGDDAAPGGLHGYV